MKFLNYHQWVKTPVGIGIVIARSKDGKYLVCITKADYTGDKKVTGNSINTFVPFEQVEAYDESEQARKTRSTTAPAKGCQ